MTKYKVGDTIIMTEKANEAYSISRAGSIGKIIEVSGNGRDYRISFSYLPSREYKETFVVESKYFKLLEPAEELTPTQIIEKTIQRMWKRQKYAKQQVMV